MATARRQLGYVSSLTVQSVPPLTYGVATGGSSSSITVGGVNYTLLTFTSTGTLTVSTGGLFDYMLVGGGGGGLATGGYGAGGGAGGITTGTISLDANQTITVGAGGGARRNGNPSGLSATSGTYRASQIAYGGGSNAGSPGSAAGEDGGSGAGGVANNGAGGLSILGQGNSGGTATTSTIGGGGGGAGGAGAGGGTGTGGAAYDVSAFIGGSTTNKAAGGSGGTTLANGAANSGDGGAFDGAGGSGICYIRFRV